MHYYQHNIADYRKDTAHLSLIEHGIYRQLLDMYYLSESKIPEETTSVYRRLCARTEEEKKAVDTILNEFFKRENGWIHDKCDKVIAIWHKRGWFPRDPDSPPNRPPIDEWKVTRNRIFERDDFTCTYCGVRGHKLECDHMTPVSLGGSNCDENLTTACKSCNRAKAAMPLDQWMALIGVCK